MGLFLKVLTGMFLICPIFGRKKVSTIFTGFVPSLVSLIFNQKESNNIKAGLKVSDYTPPGVSRVSNEAALKS